MNWINLQGKSYNTIHFRKIQFIKNNLTIEYSNGESIVLFDLSENEREILIKIISNDSTTNS